MSGDGPRIWNIWWTLTVISAAFTLIVLLLEALGVLTAVGLLLTLIFGLGASTRSSLAEFRGDVVPRLDGLRESILTVDRTLDGMDVRLERMDASLEHMDASFERMDGRLARVDSGLERVDGALERVEGGIERLAGQVGGTNERLERIITILDERLPHPTVS